MIHFPAVVCTSSPSMNKSIWLGAPPKQDDGPM
jgi:hypothetical protein